MGDGECDEPESLGAISLAGREKLDNLIFVINCNLQRLEARSPATPRSLKRRTKTPGNWDTRLCHGRAMTG